MVRVLVNNQQEQPKIIKRKKKEKNNKLDEEINSIKNEIAKANLESQEYDMKIINKKSEINLLINKRQEMINTVPKGQFIPKKKILVPTQDTYFLFRQTNIIPKRKANKFHSGPMLSDHDDTDNQKKKDEKTREQIVEVTKLVEIINKPTKETDLDFPNYILRRSKPDIDIDMHEKDLDQFYKRYTARDNKFIKTPIIYNYERVIPREFNKKEEINHYAKLEMKDRIKKQAKFFCENIKNYKIPEVIEVRELQELDKKDLEETIGHLMVNMDILNKDIEGQKEDEHFSSIKKFLYLEKLKKYEKNVEKDQ